MLYRVHACGYNRFCFYFALPQSILQYLYSKVYWKGTLTFLSLYHHNNLLSVRNGFLFYLCYLTVVSKIVFEEQNTIAIDCITPELFERCRFATMMKRLLIVIRPVRCPFN